MDERNARGHDPSIRAGGAGVRCEVAMIRDCPLSRHSIVLVIAVAVAAALGAARPACAQIGTVQHVSVWAYGTRSGATRTDLFQAATVIADEFVETVARGALHLTFLDGTELRLGGSSQATLDRYVYDPNSGKGEFAVDLALGAFLFVSGALASESYTLTTPVGVIGVRGTTLYIVISELGAVTVTVVQGAMAMVAASGQETHLMTGDSASFAPDGTVTQGVVAPRDHGVDDPRIESRRHSNHSSEHSDGN